MLKKIVKFFVGALMMATAFCIFLIPIIDESAEGSAAMAVAMFLKVDVFLAVVIALFFGGVFFMVSQMEGVA